MPDHVVFRDFAADGVALNLRTGGYHGLNRTAGVMLEALSSSSSVAEAVDTLVADRDWPRADVERDLAALCQTLADRGLVEIDAPGPSPG